MAKNNYYTVWVGRQIGVFNSWDECRLQVEGFPGAKYKGFPTREAAESAFKSEPDFGKSETEPVKSWESMPEGSPKPMTNAIAVDAACSGNPGKMEYRGVFVDTGTELFKSPVFEGGTNNIGEFFGHSPLPRLATKKPYQPADLFRFGERSEMGGCGPVQDKACREQ